MIALVYSFTAAIQAALAAWQVPYMLHGHVGNFLAFGFCLTLALYSLGKALRA